MNKKQSIAMLFATWPRRDSEQPMDLMVKAYEAALLYCEPWSVDMAVGRFIRGTAKDHDMAFRPTGPQIAQLATSLQSEEGRIKEITDRVEQQTNLLEYHSPPRERRFQQVKIWDRIKREMRQPNVHDLALAYMAMKLSVPGTTFDITGAHFPDGTHHTVDEMRARVSEPKPGTLDQLEWQEAMEEITQ